MNYLNYTDVLNLLDSYGLVIDSTKLSFDGRFNRWPTKDSKGADKPGWTRFTVSQSKAGHSYINGSFGIWEGTDDGKQRVPLYTNDDPTRPILTAEDIEAARAAQKAASQALAEERKREAKTAAGWAAQVWSKCAPDAHPYYAKKDIEPHGTRVLADLADLRLPGIDDTNWWRLQQAIGSLAVPMHDIHGNVVGLQLIATDGSKAFWPTGMAMGGSFGVIGGWRRNGILLLTEGFATAASVRQATDQSVAYAFSANNLGKAAKAIRAKYKGIKILICADDDYLTEKKTGKNPGVDAAMVAANEIESAAWIKPDFTEDGRDLRDGAKLTDFNDLMKLRGTLVLAHQINARLDALKWRDAAPMRAGSSAKGGGEAAADGQQRRRAEAIMPLDDIIARFMPLDDGTGQYVFDTWTNKIANQKQMIALLPAGVRGDDIKRHPVWQERGAFFLDEVGFDPSGNDRIVKLNTWRGWPMQAKAGTCDRLLALLHYLCDTDEIFTWTLRWMAYPLQHPGAKMASAIIMHGPQGTGKSTVWQCLAKIYGDYATVLNQRGLEDRFNSDWVDSKLFLMAEEVVTRAEMWHIKNELKELITGEWVRVNPKNVAAYRQRNQVNCVFLSNENQPLPLDNDDRRHCVIYTPPALSESEYDEVFLEIENGGIEAFYHHLLTLDLGDFHPKKRPPMTEAKQALIALSSPSEVRFIHDWSMGELDYPVCPAKSTDVYSAYLKWCRINGEARPRPSNQFHGAVARLPGWSKEKRRIYDDLKFSGDSKPTPMIIPPDHLITDKTLKKVEGHHESVWFTTGAVAFNNAMGNTWTEKERAA
jgi:putative DNA primase/helicase